jgi:SAM-dependent methyltransferase
MKITSKAWDKRFKKEGKVFEEPHEDMSGIISALKEKGARTILDLGSGSGRHVVFLARNGFSVFGLDNSPEGTRIAKNWLEHEGLSADFHVQEMTAPLPYPDIFFDAVISIQVIHHARPLTIKRIVKEVARVLKKDGFVFMTVPKEKTQAKEFMEIEPCTFIPLDGPEKGLPHYYFTPEKLDNFFIGFSITDIHQDSTGHYCLSGFKR